MRTAQGALEYLLLIGGAILVAVIAIALILNLTESSETEVFIAAAHALCSKYPDEECAAQTIAFEGASFNCVTLGKNECRAIQGTLISACGTAFVANETYFLTQDLSDSSTCLNITVDGVKLYCNGKTITVSGGRGIIVGGNDNLISNCKISSSAAFFSAMRVSGSNNIIRNNKILLSSVTGIFVNSSSTNNTLQNNDVCGANGTNQIDIRNGDGQNPASSGNICDTCSDPGGTEVCTGGACPIAC